MVRASNAFMEIAVALGASSRAAFSADQFGFAAFHVFHFVFLPLLYIDIFPVVALGIRRM